jgi:hypothetical protein
VTCHGGNKGNTPEAKPVRSKRSADVAMDTDVPGPSKVAKLTRLATARLLQATSLTGSPPPTSLSTDLSNLAPCHPPCPRALRIAASVPSLSLITPPIPSSSSAVPTSSGPISIDTSEVLLLSICHVCNRVNSFAAGIYQELDDLEDKVRESRTHK